VNPACAEWFAGRQAGGDVVDDDQQAVGVRALGRMRGRYTPGSRARQISTLRRIAPSRAFDSRIRRFDRLAA
jgi:hypothetical protein